MTDNNTPSSGTPPNPLDVLSSMPAPQSLGDVGPAAEPVDAAAQAVLNQALTGVTAPPTPTTETPKESPVVSAVEPEIVVESAFTTLTSPQTTEPQPGPMPVPEALTLTEHPIDSLPATEPASAMPLPSITDTPMPTPAAPVIQAPPGVPATDPKDLEKKAAEIIGKPPKKKMNPKVKIAAAGLAMLVLVGGIAFAVVEPVRRLATTGSITEESAHACTWVETEFGSGCADNEHLYYDNRTGKKAKTVYVAKDTIGTNNDSDLKATTGCNEAGTCGFTKAPKAVQNVINDVKAGKTNARADEVLTIADFEDQDKSGSSGGSGGYTTCNAPSDCPAGEGLSCVNGACAKEVPGTGVCPDGFTNLPYSGKNCVEGTSQCASVTCIKGVPPNNAAFVEGGACANGSRSPCGSSGKGDRAQGLCVNGIWTSEYTDSCSTPVTEGTSCAGLSRYSPGEKNKGAFMGCKGEQNCFCDYAGGGTDPNSLTGTIHCQADPGNDSCGANKKEAVVTAAGPTPEPTVPPKGKYMLCQNITSTNATPKIGDTVTFSCKASARTYKIAYYTFRYNVNHGEWKSLTQQDFSSSTSAPLKVTEYGTYKVQCRACNNAKTPICTPWSSAN